MRSVRFLSLVLALVLLFTLAAPPARADYAASYWDPAMGLYRYSGNHVGIVLATRLTVRERPATNAASLGSVKNGRPMRILGITRLDDPANAFFLVDLPSCGVKDADPGSVGYVKVSLVKLDPYFIAATRLTNLYATPWSTELKNGEQNDRFFLVVDEGPGWYAVQTISDSAGTSFIRTGDVGNYSKGALQYVVTWETPLYDEVTWTQTRTVKRFAVGRLISSGGDHVLMVFDEGKSTEYRGWIALEHASPLVN